MSTSAAGKMIVRPFVRRRGVRMAGILPYLLSLPALLVCIGILIPFGTAVYYSAAALQSRRPGHAEVHLVRQLYFSAQ